MPSTYGETATDLVGVLREVVVRMQQLSGADIVALYPYDSDTQSFYAPVALGISDEGLLRSLPDMADQLRRYREDAAQGKAPEDLQPTQYGPNVWLIVNRHPLVANNAPRQVDSSFIRRNKIHGVIGLPLLAGKDLVALLYLNYVEGSDRTTKDEFPSGRQISELEEEAAQAALAIEHARKAEDLAAFRATTEMVGQLATVLPDTEGHDGQSFNLQIEHTLAVLLRAIGADAAAIYALDDQTRRLDLVAAQGLTGPFAPSISVPQGAATWDLSGHPELQPALQNLNLHELAVLPLHTHEQYHGALLVAGEDPLALTRKPATVRLLLQAAADLIGGTLENRSLVDAMEETNRTMAALSDLGKALLQPGASQEQVLNAVVAQLTDPHIPEFDFEFATIYLLGATGQHEMVVRRSAGATHAETIDSIPASEAGIAAAQSTFIDVRGNGHGIQRVPRWVLQSDRRIDERDVLAFVARQQRAVVVAAKADNQEQDFVLGFPDTQIDRLLIPIARAGDQTKDTVKAVVLRGASSQTPSGDGYGRTAPAVTRDLQLQGDLFDASGHANLIRVFVPFGVDQAAGGRATGVLEAGYHISRKRQFDRRQIEALNAAAAQIAVAVETARLYEDSKKRAEHLEIVAEVSRAIASSIDLEQTLRLVARNMVRALDTSICLIALFEDDGSAWYGGAASDDEDLWRRQRVERPEKSILFEAADRRQVMVVEDAQTSDLVRPNLVRLFRSALTRRAALARGRWAADRGGGAGGTRPPA